MWWFSVVGGSCLAQSIVMGSVLLVACHHHSSMRRSAHCSAWMMSLVRDHETQPYIIDGVTVPSKETPSALKWTSVVVRSCRSWWRWRHAALMLQKPSMYRQVRSFPETIKTVDIIAPNPQEREQHCGLARINSKTKWNEASRSRCLSEKLRKNQLANQAS